jgi:gliding motility-associated-like protein
VNLEVYDTNGCVTSLTQIVTYQPVPSLILVRPNDTLGCPPADLLFTNLSNPIDENYDIRWDFGDGKTSSALSPVHRYEEPGVYDVTLEITTPIGCFYDTTFVGLVSLVEAPVANFDYSPDSPSNLEPEVSFTDQSIDAIRWEWYVDGELVALEPDPIYTFPDTGLQEIVLIVTHPEGCHDTISQIIDVEPKVTYHMPNAFTPNEDTNNDYFRGTGITLGVSDFRMEIWDRWGKKIFETTELEDAWNGRVNNTGKQVQEGVYVCVVTFTGPRGEPFEYKGYATVLR